MKNYQKINCAAFVAAIILTAIFSVAAQQLKPTEIIYSRLPTNLNAAPTGANSPTIWAVGQDGSNDRQIALGTQPRISDDGRFLLFKRGTGSSFDPSGNPNQLWVRELATGQETLVYSVNCCDGNNIGYYFSPESNRGNYEIVFDNTCFMYKMNRDGSNIFQFPWLNAPYCYDDYPVVRRGDSLIAFQNLNGDAATSGLYTVGINGENRQKILNTNYLDFNPAWSNDGQTIAYGITSTANRYSLPYYAKNLYKIKPDGTGKQQLTNFNSNSGQGDCGGAATDCATYGMVWTEDNTKIIAAARIGGVAGIYVINADGSGTRTRIPLSAGNAPDFVGGIVQTREEQQVASTGGGVSASGNYTLVDTIGETVAGQTSTGGAYSFESGFWSYFTAAPNKTLFDFDGDGKSDISVFRPSSGVWYLQQSTNGFSGAQFGFGTDKIVPADYDGDGKTDLAVFRDGTWYIQRSSLGFTGIGFGLSGDIPVPADYDGDGKADEAVFRGGIWYISQSQLGFTGIQFGIASDVPTVGDYDGDGKADEAVYRGGIWYLNRSQLGFTGVGFGLATDIPAAADYDGDGKTDIAVFRPSSGVWYLQQSTNGFTGIAFGQNGDQPIPAAFVP